MVGVRLGEELEAKLAALSASLRRPKSSLIREAIENKIEDWEDLQMITESLRDTGQRWTAQELLSRYSVSADDMED